MIKIGERKEVVLYAIIVGLIILLFYQANIYERQNTMHVQTQQEQRKIIVDIILGYNHKTTTVTIEGTQDGAGNNIMGGIISGAKGKDNNTSKNND